MFIADTSVLKYNELKTGVHYIILLDDEMLVYLFCIFLYIYVIAIC